MGILAELSANVDPVKSLMYVACRRSGYIILAVQRHWEGIIELNKLCVGTEPVELTLLVEFTLGARFKKAWLCLNSPGLCFRASLCREVFLCSQMQWCTCHPTDLIVAAVFRQKVSFAAYFDTGR